MGIFLSIWVANMEHIYWSICLFIRRGEDGVKGRIVILVHCVVHFIKEEENLV